jgi:hypothetical protein
MQVHLESSIVSRRTWLALIVGIFVVTCLPAIVATDSRPSAGKTSPQELTPRHAVRGSDAAEHLSLRLRPDLHSERTAEL